MAAAFWNNRKSRRRFLIVTAIVLVLALLVGACALYLGDYYRADGAAIETFAPVAYETLENGNLVFAPEGATRGLIFYPGGKVEHTAYIPLMSALAQQGILCVLVEMPFRLAVLDSAAADGIPAQYPQIESWYLGGHSLGGSMAAAYLEKHAADYKGLVLLGSYSTANLSDSGLAVLSVYGSEDQVLNREKYAKYKENLPEDTREAEISGGCHAGFGMYGPQEGDGTPTISTEEQLRQTAALITAWISQ